MIRFLMGRYRQSRTLLNFWLLAGAVGVALSTKYSGVFLMPAVFLALAVDAWQAVTRGVHDAATIARCLKASAVNRLAETRAATPGSDTLPRRAQSVGRSVRRQPRRWQTSA